MQLNMYIRHKSWLQKLTACLKIYTSSYFFLYFAVIATLQKLFYQTKISLITEDLLLQVVTSPPFRAARSSQANHLVNVFIYLLCLFCLCLFSALRRAELLGLIDGKRFWLLPEKHDWCPWDGAQPARILLSLLDVPRAPRWWKLDIFWVSAHMWRLQKPLWFAYTSEAIRNVHDIAVAQSLLWLVLTAA